MQTAEMYTRYKRLLFTLAFQLTGTAADAEDAVQDVFMKLGDIDPDHLKEPKAYLCKMVTNRCLDQLKSARKRRESYVGPWLPEPLPTGDPDSFDAIATNDLLSYAMVALLERLSPSERAVFVLREALGFEYAEIAELTGKSEGNCRKLISRARSKMGISKEDPLFAQPIDERWMNRFLAALEHEDAEEVMSLLADDVVLYSDGGGKASAATKPIASKDRVVRFLLGALHKIAGSMQVELAPAFLNGQEAFIYYLDGRPDGAVFFRVEEGKLRSVHIIRNPDKLSRIRG